MKIAFVASEITPFAKTGGLADVAGALPPALQAMGHELRIFMPLYASVRDRFPALAPVADIQHVPLQLGEHGYHFSLFSTGLPGTDLPVYFIDCPALYSRAALYTGDADEHRRFLLLQCAVLESLQRMRFAPDILHCNDWHTALLPLLIKTRYAWDRLFQPTRTLLSIHNIGYQGVFAASAMLDTGITDVMSHIRAEDRANGLINWMREGIHHADAVNTVSPTYAREICQPEGGYGLDATLRARQEPVIGILNGVDYHTWNPATDELLPARYRSDDLAGKAVCKQALLKHSGWSPGTERPIIGMVSRLAQQKGIDLLQQALPELLRSRDFALCMLGSGDSRYVEFFNQLAAQFPDRVSFTNGYNEALAHLIEAGSDLFLMPSLYEPCGLNQMYSLKYGTLPIVRKTGGLADSVQMWDGTNGNGIVFNDYDAPAVHWAVNTALDLWKDPATRATMIHDAMTRDFSWNRQALEYVRLYEHMTRRM